jgi:hypothetical protein
VSLTFGEEIPDEGRNGPMCRTDTVTRRDALHGYAGVCIALFAGAEK